MRKVRDSFGSPAERMGRLILNEMEKTNLSANRETETESFTTLFAMLEMHETAIKDIISYEKTIFEEIEFFF